MASFKIIKRRGILRLLLNSYGLAQSGFKESRKGRVLGIYVKRPGLENQVKAIIT